MDLKRCKDILEDILGFGSEKMERYFDFFIKRKIF
jgi:hypothetical protein